jgi:hypothetical protein
VATETFDLRHDWSNEINGRGAWSYREGKNLLPPVKWWQQKLKDSHGGWEVAQVAWARSADGTNRLPVMLKSNGNENFNHDWEEGDIVIHCTDATNGKGQGIANVLWRSPVAGSARITGELWQGITLGRTLIFSLILNGFNKTEVLEHGELADRSQYTSIHPRIFEFAGVSVAKGSMLELQIAPHLPNAPGCYAVVNLSVEVEVAEASRGQAKPRASKGSNKTL